MVRLDKNPGLVSLSLSSFVVLDLMDVDVEVYLFLDESLAVFIIVKGADAAGAAGAGCAVVLIHNLLVP